MLLLHFIHLSNPALLVCCAAHFLCFHASSMPSGPASACGGGFISGMVPSKTAFRRASLGGSTAVDEYGTLLEAPSPDVRSTAFGSFSSYADFSWPGSAVGGAFFGQFNPQLK